jgi:hypothetical protein
MTAELPQDRLACGRSTRLVFFHVGYLVWGTRRLINCNKAPAIRAARQATFAAAARQSSKDDPSFIIG